MNADPLDENVRKLEADVREYRVNCEKWWGHHARRKNILLIASILFALGATVSGAWGRPHIAATFSALGGAVIAAQNAYRFQEHEKFYGGAVTECDRLSRKLSYQVGSSSDFDGVAQAFDQLRSREGLRGHREQ